MEVMYCYKRENWNFFSLKLIKTIKTTQNEATPLFDDIFEMIFMSFLPHQKKGLTTILRGQKWNLSCVL